MEDGRLGWMDGVKVALGNRRLIVEAARWTMWHCSDVAVAVTSLLFHREREIL